MLGPFNAAYVTFCHQAVDTKVEMQLLLSMQYTRLLSSRLHATSFASNYIHIQRCMGGTFHQLLQPIQRFRMEIKALPQLLASILPPVRVEKLAIMHALVGVLTIRFFITVLLLLMYRSLLSLLLFYGVHKFKKLEGIIKNFLANAPYFICSMTSICAITCGLGNCSSGMYQCFPQLAAALDIF